VLASSTDMMQNYQTLIYNNLGYKGQEALFITALYGFMASIGQAASIFSIADHWPRRRTVSEYSPASSFPFPGNDTGFLPIGC